MSEEEKPDFSKTPTTDYTAVIGDSPIVITMPAPLEVLPVLDTGPSCPTTLGEVWVGKTHVQLDPIKDYPPHTPEESCAICDGCYERLCTASVGDGQNQVCTEVSKLLGFEEPKSIVEIEAEIKRLQAGYGETTDVDFVPNWSEFPKLASIFENRPATSVYVTELRNLLKAARADAVRTTALAKTSQAELQDAFDRGVSFGRRRH